MHVAVAVWSTTIKKVNEYEYVEAIIAGILASDPQHTLVLITDNVILTPTPPVKTLQVPLVSTYFGLRRWYSSILPALLKKEKADLLIVINGSPATTSIPQLPIFISAPATLRVCITWLRFLYKKYLAKRLQKAAAIGVITHLQEPYLAKFFGIKDPIFFVTGYAVPATYQPMNDWQQREAFLQRQTGGKEYFLYAGAFSETRFLHLLKAFSLFKKRQQSNMQLLVPGEIATNKKFQEKLDTYKYRQDVQFTNTWDESFLPQLNACAYAVLFTEENTVTAQPVAAAMQCHIPVIGVETNESMKEIAGAGALYTDASVESLAEQMKQIYKDENLRQSLIFNIRQQWQQVDGREAGRKILTHLTKK